MANKKEKAVVLIGFLPDPRMYKRINLEKTLYELHLICWDRGSDMLLPPVEDGYQAHVIKVDANNDPIKRIIPYTRFSTKAKKYLEEIRPQLINVQGLDMLRIALSYKHKNPNVRVIYEVADLHRLLVDKQKTPLRILAQKYLISQDKQLCKSIDLLIVTSEKYVESYFCNLVPEEKTLVIPNVPKLDVFKTYRKKDRQQPLTIGFIGGIRYKQQIRNLLFASQSCGVNVLMAGFESGENEIENICEGMPNVEWFGKFDFDSQVAGLYEKCDLIYSVYDADMANVRVALPNKLYESIYCEKPIIVAKGTYLAELVKRWGVGVAVDHRGPDELENVLRRFQSEPALFQEIEQNCRKHKDICDFESYNSKLKNILYGWEK